MGRCHYLIYPLFVGSLFLTLQLVASQTQDCFGNARLKVLELFYNGNISDAYTCDDMQLIQHGTGCNKKCNSITLNLRNQFGCDPSFVFPQCPIRPRQSEPIASDCEMGTPSCDFMYEYRKIDGSCNNLMHPLWGKSHRGQNRLVPDAYDDAKGSPRTMGCNGQVLPGARKVSINIHRAENDMKFHPRLSYMMMQMGQFLAHDMVLTNLITRSDGEPLQCCKEDFLDPECFPIGIPEEDYFFKPYGCMNFGRSRATTDCNDVRQQVNSQTSYLDLSVLYGATDEHAMKLRSFKGGNLMAVGKKLPVDLTDELCELSRPQEIPNYYCTRSGDERVNEQPGLSSIHTVLMREHNRLVDQLSLVNPHWDDERLYQEARKINIAQWQNIVYFEYLPLVLGPFVMMDFDLTVMPFGYKDTYDAMVDATILNGFAVAAFRFGHTLIHRDVSMMRLEMNDIFSTQPLHQHFFDPGLYHSNSDAGMENILLWTSATKCPFSDRRLEPSVHQSLFLDKKSDSLDLAALNIQRSRDHGVPGYTAFRRVCGLSEVTHFGTGPGGLVDHDPHEADLLKKVYACPEDIDLFSGFLSERLSQGSILGPTGQCIIAMQFKRLRDGDRFFFERMDFFNPRIGFNPAQLAEIKKVRMSTLFCLNTSIERLQDEIFLQPNVGTAFSSNELKDCNRDGINLDLWME